MTVLADRFGTEYPIVQAPMAGSQGSALAIAVSNAGGLGSLPCALLSLESMHSELAAIRAGTAKPYSVNFFCHQPPRPDAVREAAWRAILAPYYRECGLDFTMIPEGAPRHPFDAVMADLLAEFKPPVVSFHFGLPSDELVAAVRSWGAKIISSATTIEEGRWLARRGVDAIVAQGLEAGGHRGIFLSDDLTSQLGTLPLVSQLVRAVDVPIIAAGGIGDGRGVAAMMALGAAGVQVGTAFLPCSEATTTSVHRAALASPAAGHTALTNLFTGRPARGIVNRFMRECGPLSSAPPAFPTAVTAVAPLRAWAEERGLGDFSPLWAGQHASTCRSIPAAAVLHELVTGSGR